tara:strand:- start:326 stop:574 length:249 start_codon:yes stop_codon:yes gene_type:complete
MPNYRISLDLSDLQHDLAPLELTEYRLPFCMYFIEASDADEACYEILLRIMNKVLENGRTIKNRVICRKIRRYMRIDKIECL